MNALPLGINNFSTIDSRMPSDPVKLPAINTGRNMQLA